MLYYKKYELEKDLPWVTFVHGAGGSSSIWFKQLRDFRKNFNLLLVDLRGHGKSKKGNEESPKYRFSNIGDDVIDVLNHLNIAKSHFVGISLGTIIIRELTERYPNRISSMIMGGAVMKINIRGQILMNVGNWFKTVIPYLYLYKLFAFVIMPRKSHQESRNVFINEAKKLYQKEFKRWFALVAQINPLLRLFRFKDSGIPTLYIMGEEDHMFLPSVSKLVENHHSSELFVIPNCGHVVNIEKPEEFNRSAISFLSRFTNPLH